MSANRTISVQLNQSALFQHSVAANPVGSGVGSVSAEVSYLFLVVDALNEVAEGSESNNSGQGAQIDSDDVTYFPWDQNGNGTVEPLEALSTIQAIGTPNFAKDFDGNGIVTPLEALSVIQRIGYQRNQNVDEGTMSGQAQPIIAVANIAVFAAPVEASALQAAATLEPADKAVAGEMQLPFAQPGASAADRQADVHSSPIVAKSAVVGVAAAIETNLWSRSPAMTLPDNLQTPQNFEPLTPSTSLNPEFDRTWVSTVSSTEVIGLHTPRVGPKINDSDCLARISLSDSVTSDLTSLLQAVFATENTLNQAESKGRPDQTSPTESSASQTAHTAGVHASFHRSIEPHLGITGKGPVTDVLFPAVSRLIEATIRKILEI
ncbi:MAG: hypothetical protein R3C49_01750 [Planctomycetaceae bacterium]